MKCIKKRNNINILFFIILFIIYLRKLSANFTISNFTYYNGKSNVNIELFETDYLAIFKLSGDSIDNSDFEISDSYLIFEDKNINNCHIYNYRNVVGTIKKEKDHDKFLFVQKKNVPLHIKNNKYRCSNFYSVNNSPYPVQIIEKNKEYIKVEGLNNCSIDDTDKFIFYFNLLENFYVSENEKCDQIAKSSFITNIGVNKCTGYIGYVEDLYKLNNDTYYICFKSNNLSMVVHKISINKTIMMNTFYCNYENLHCSIYINPTFIKNIPNIEDDTLVLQPECGDTNIPILKNNHILNHGYYTFNFDNSKAYYYLEICLMDTKKYKKIGHIFFLQVQQPIICFIGYQCVIKTYTLKSQMDYILGDIRNTTFSWSDEVCNYRNFINQGKKINALKIDDYLYFNSVDVLTNENNFCLTNQEIYAPLFTILLVKNPEFSIYYSIINDILINYSTHSLKYNNYLGPYLKYECSNNNIVKDEYDNHQRNDDFEFLYKNEKLNITLKYKTITMRLCLKLVNYYDIGSVKIEQLSNFKKNSLSTLKFSGIVSLFHEDKNTKILKFAIKESEDCHSDKGFFIEANSNLKNKTFYQNKINDIDVIYEGENNVNLDKFKYYLCMCSKEEKCRENNNLKDYYTYTNISIYNDSQPQKKKIYVCKLLFNCSFTATFHSTHNSDKWISKKGKSCSSNELVGIGVNSKNNVVLSNYPSNLRVIDFDIYYFVSQMNMNLLNTDIIICGNYNDQELTVSIESNFFLVYQTAPYEELEIVNIEHSNLCHNKKTLFIYSYLNGKKNLFKKIEIDEKKNFNKIKLKFDYKDLENNEIYFIKECHYCPNILTYNHNEGHYIFQSSVKNSEKYWGIKKLKNNNFNFTSKAIDIFNCSNESAENHALTSVIIFDGPLKEIEFYCYMGFDCSHKVEFSLSVDHYSFFIEITETFRITIFYKETPKIKHSVHKLSDSKRISKLDLKISKNGYNTLKPGPYKIIYSRKINGLTVETYIGTFHYIGAPLQKYHIVDKNQKEIVIYGYFKNVESEKLKIVSYSTCDFVQLLNQSLGQNKHDDILNEVLNSVIDCKYHDDYKLICNYKKSIINKFDLCWCYEVEKDLCKVLKNINSKITEISSLSTSMSAVLQITKSSHTKFINYEINNYIFIIDDDCTNIKNIKNKSKMNTEKNILGIYTELKSPQKYELCVCTIEQNVTCEKENEYKSVTVLMNSSTSHTIKSTNLNNFNKGNNIVKDFDFKLDYIDNLKKNIIPVFVFLPGPVEYKEFICMSGVPCNATVKIKSSLNIIGSNDANNKNNNNNAVNANNASNVNGNVNNSGVNSDKNGLYKNINSIFFILSDSKDCEDNYNVIYKSEIGSIYVIQEIEHLEFQFIDGVYNLKIDIVPKDVTKTYEICASFHFNDKHYYNVGNIVFYGIFNDNDQYEAISGFPFSLEIKQFYSNFNLYIRFIYKKYGDIKTCNKKNRHFEKIIIGDSVENALKYHELEKIDDNFINYKWNNITIILDIDNFDYMTSSQNKDGSHNIVICSCYELEDGHCDSDDFFTSEVMTLHMHTAILKEPRINSTVNFLKPFTLKLETSKTLNGSIKVFPIDIMEDLNKLCLELNQRKMFSIYKAEIDEHEQIYNILTNFLAQGLVICWCSKDKCNDNDYLTKVAFFKMNSPNFLEVDTDLYGYFSFYLLNEYININDRVIFVDSKSMCSDNNKVNLFGYNIQLDNDNYVMTWEQSIEIYGKPEKIVREIDQKPIWVSKKYKISNVEEKYIKICYCFYFYDENCKNTKNYIYVGLIYNNTLKKKITKSIVSNDSIDETSNLHYFSKDAIKFVALSSFNDYNRNICNNNSTQYDIMPFRKINAFNYSTPTLRILNIFNKSYRNELNFTVCYNNFFFGNKTRFSLKGKDISDINSHEKFVEYNYELSKLGFTYDSKVENIIINDPNITKRKNLELSLNKYKSENSIFRNYFFIETPLIHSISNIYRNEYIGYSDKADIREKLKNILDQINEDSTVNLNETIYYKNKGELLTNFYLEKIIIVNKKKFILCCNNGDYVEVEINNKKYEFKYSPKVDVLINSLKSYHPDFEKDEKFQNAILEQFNDLVSKSKKYNYLKIKNPNDVGFYKNHTFIQVKDTIFTVMINGNNIPDHKYILYIIEFNNSCYNLDKNLFFIESKLFTRENNYLTFRDIFVNKINNYKLCILDSTYNVYYNVGILNVTNYYVNDDSFFGIDNLPSNIKKKNIILNVCMNIKSYDVFIIKRRDSFRFSLDMKKVRFFKNIDKLIKTFHEIENDEVISCKSKIDKTIILTKSHIFFYTKNKELSFSTKHNLLFPVDIDFDDTYIYVTDLHLKKIARLKILNNGNLNLKRKKRDIYNNELKLNKFDLNINNKKTFNKNSFRDNLNKKHNFQHEDTLSYGKYPNIYNKQPEIIKKKLLINKLSKGEDIILNKNKQNDNNNLSNYFLKNFNLNKLRSAIKNEENQIVYLEQSNRKNSTNDIKGDEQIKFKNHVLKNYFDTSKKKNKKAYLVKKNFKKLYNYFQEKKNNNILSHYLHKIISDKNISKKGTLLYNFIEYIKNKKEPLEEKEVDQKVESLYNMRNDIKQINKQNIDDSKFKSSNLMRKKRSATYNIDQSIYDKIIQRNIKKFTNIVETPKYLPNNLDYLNLKNLKNPLYISIHNDLLYVLDSSKNNFFSYNLKNNKIIELEEYNFSSNILTLKNPRNFSIYQGEITEHTTHRTSLAFVTQINSNEIKIIDLNKEKYKIIKSLKLRKGYKHNNINNVIGIDQKLLIITSQIYDENLIYHYHFNSFDNYFNISFHYTFAENYNSNDNLNVKPEIGKYSDSIIFFCFLKSDNKCTNVDELTNLNISYDTGIITGKLNYFGNFQLQIFAKTHFQYKINTYKNLYSYCDVAKEYNKEKSICESCPIGTFWNREKLLCEKCDEYFKNTSTLKIGSKLITDCLCSAGYEYSDKTASCEQCKPGYYKKSVGNFICIKGCQINEKSVTYGATSYKKMFCKCVEGYYRKNDKCVLCLENHYCPGNDVLTACDKNKISKKGARSANDCECEENFILNNKNGKCSYCASIAKVIDDVIYCSLCNPKYLDINVFRTPFKHNYGLVDSTYNYNEDFVLQSKIMKYAYFNKNNAEKNFFNYITINHKQNQLKNNQNMQKFSIEVDVADVKKCLFCESGYFINHEKNKCIPCNNKYCEGFSSVPKDCPKNSIVIKKNSSSIFDCLCKPGYGSSNERRNGLNKKLSCEICPMNFFKHTISDNFCMPCPHFTYTLSEGSTSIFNCLPKKGYFLYMFRNIDIDYLRYKFDINSENGIYSFFENNDKNFDNDIYDLFLEQNFKELFDNMNNNSNKNTQSKKFNKQSNNQINNQKNVANNSYNLKKLESLGFLKKTSIFHIYTSLLKNIEQKYMWMTDNMLRVTCHVNLNFKKNPNFTITYKPNLKSCIDDCKKNIYCTGIEFSRKNVEYTQIFLKNNQKVIVGYFKCKNFYFQNIYEYTSSNIGNFLNKNVENQIATKSTLEYTNFLLRNKKDIIFTCSIDRDRKYLLYKSYQVVECFIGKFCPGNKTPYLVSCPTNSTTLVNLATDIDECLCIKGYAYVGVLSNRCAVCDRGTYKETIGNVKCETCPLTFSTVNTGSTSVNDCSCTPGNYLTFDTLGNFVNSENINYKNIHNKYFIIPKKKEKEYYITEVKKISFNGFNDKDDKDIKKILKLHVGICKACSLDNHYCEGGLESNIIFNNTVIEGIFHTLPKKCPKELVIPRGIKQRTSLNNCLCIHGKVLRTSKDKTIECFPCPPNTFKESEYDNSCSGACPHFSTTFVGSSYENQCFCKNNYYLITPEDEHAENSKSKKSCKVCPKGAVCNRGFNIYVFLKLLNDRAYNDINILDHENPYPINGYYAVYKVKNSYKPWNPLDDNDDLKYTYPYYSLMLFIQKNIENKNYFFFEKNQKYYLNEEFLENINKRDKIKSKSNKSDKQRNSYNTSFKLQNSLSFFQSEEKYHKLQRVSKGRIINFKEVNISDTSNLDSSLLTNQDINFSFLETNGNISNNTNNSEEYSLEIFSKYIKEANELKKINSKFERLPDIHPCTLPDRCLGTIANLCSEGSTGYQCNNCKKNYDTSYFKSKCYRCKNLLYEVLHIILLKLLYYFIVILIVSLNYNSCINKLYISGILIKIWFNCSFSFIAYGFFSPNTQSFIAKYLYLYKMVFLFHLKFFSYYLRIGCFFNYYNIDVSYNNIWYIQKYMKIFSPLIDGFFITFILFIIVQISKFYYKEKIRNFENLLSQIPDLRDEYKKEIKEECTQKQEEKKKNKKKIHIINELEEKEIVKSDKSTLIHDLEKNNNTLNDVKQNNKSLLNNIKNKGDRMKKFKIKRKDKNEKHQKEINESVNKKNEEDIKYKLKYIKNDEIYKTFLKETIEYIYNIRIFGPWRFMNKRNETFRKKLAMFLSDNLPCYVLMTVLSIPYVLLELIQLLYCKPVGYKSQKKELYLTYLTTQKCSLSHRSFLLSMVVILLTTFFYLGICFILSLLYIKRKKISLFNSLLKNLLAGYRQGKAIFELLFLLKNTILVFIIAFNVHYQMYYIVLVTLTLTIFAIFEILYSPFDRRSFNILNKSLCVGSVLNIFFSLIMWGSFYWDYEKFSLFPISIILFYHLFMLHNVVKEIILSRHFMNKETLINIETSSYEEDNIKSKNYKIYYKVMNKIKFFLNKNQKKKLSKMVESNVYLNKADNASKHDIKFEPIENIIKRYNLKLNSYLINDKNNNIKIEENKNEKELFNIKKNVLPVNIHNVAFIWYDDQNEDLLFQMPYENKFCYDLNGEKRKKKKKKNFLRIFSDYIRDKRKKKNFKYFVLALVEIIEKFIDVSRSCSIYENWFDFSIRFSFVYISWIKNLNKTKSLLPSNMDQLHKNMDQFIFKALFYENDMIIREEKISEDSSNINNKDLKNEECIETLEKKNSFENTEIKISRSFGSYNKLGSLKNRKKHDETVKNEELKEYSILGNDHDSLYLSKNEEGKTQNKKENEKKEIYNINNSTKKSNKEISEKHLNNMKENSHCYKEEENSSQNITEYSIDVFSTEMFNEDIFKMLISLFELYIAMKTLKSLNSDILSKLYKRYNEKCINFETSVMFNINKLKEELKLEIEEINNEINNGNSIEKLKMKTYYFYKEELIKRKMLEEELMNKIKSLEECIEAKNKSQSLRNKLKDSKKKKINNENVDEYLNRIFFLLQNEGTYKLNHPENTEQKR
ncbi:cysteine repeat modular protein 4, putative [Plasmodium gallinaceum]|uniref:Cysteine repeat modular protein 4, putative n=1 Tax=Plasmodium gallinaceum TaxID=5849 RepID=A0A1J1GQM6_PLAGA|nr:cysteine repeat modular protein 4, putative [Plasmodium gallinaceum]CRG94564.1 cysteine repeat modular protein 4, putative [Plasmodium gallinaceum]